MANEKRLIYANALIAEIDEEMNPLFDLTNHYKAGYWNGLVEARRIAERMPTVDAVEVVRCKDCDKSKRSPLFGRGWRFCKNNQQHHKDEHFCSYGERRD
jgi:hypothetical protein